MLLRRNARNSAGSVGGAAAIIGSGDAARARPRPAAACPPAPVSAAIAASMRRSSSVAHHLSPLGLVACAPLCRRAMPEGKALILTMLPPPSPAGEPHPLRPISASIPVAFSTRLLHAPLVLAWPISPGSCSAGGICSSCSRSPARRWRGAMPTIWSSTRRSASSSAGGSAMCCSTARDARSTRSQVLQAVGRRHVVPRRRDRRRSLAILLLRGSNKLNWLRVHDYVACVRAVRAVLRAARQFRERRAVGQADRRRLGDHLPAHRRRIDPRATRASSTRRGSKGIAAVRDPLVRCSGRPRRATSPGKLVGIFLLGYGAAPLLRRILPRARRAARGTSSRRPACTWASGCACR